MNNNDARISTHPSYGQIKASRVNSNPPMGMYGSNIRHGHYVMLEISTSEIQREVGRDWFHGRKQLVQLRMSETQFAEFITSLNCGSGTPCTFERLDGKLVENPPFIDETHTVRGEFDKKAKEVAKALADAQDRLATLLAPGSKITKTELGLLQNEINRAAREIGSNMPHMNEQFVKTMEDTIGEAKATVEAFLVNAAAHAGLSTSKLHEPGAILSIESE